MTEYFFPRDDYFRHLALREAERALEHGDVPIGAVVVRDGEVVASAHNERELRQDPTAHAELIALRDAARAEETRLTRESPINELINEQKEAGIELATEGSTS